MEDIILPEVFPTAEELTRDMNELVTRARTRAVDNTFRALPESIRGLVTNAVLHEPINLRDPSRSLHDFRVLSQFIGAVLYYPEILNNMTQGHPLHFLNTGGIKVVNEGPHIGLKLLHKVPSRLDRYLSRLPADIRIEHDVGGVMSLTWVLSSEDHMDMLISNMVDAIKVYHKLTTRTELCQHYQQCLPGFTNS